MGFRYKLSRLPKKELGNYKDFEFEELEKELNIREDDSFIELPEQQELLTLQCDITQEFLDNHCSPFFTKFNLYEHNGHVYQIITKKGLYEVLEQYNNEITKILDRQIALVEAHPETALFELQQKREKWNISFGKHKVRPYLLLDNKKEGSNLNGSIVGDGAMEYQIFNVVFIINTFNWEKDYLILSGW